MTTETVEAPVVDQATDTADQPDSDFDAGFEGRAEQTTTPDLGDEPKATEEESAAAPAAPADPEPAPKLAQITEDQFKVLMDKAAEVDQIKADSKRQIDTLAGHLGGMKQLVEGLKQQRATMSPGQLKRVSAEFPELGKLLAEDLGELSAPEVAAIDPAEIDRRAQAIVAQELPKIEQRMEIKLLQREHKDWVDVVRSQEFMDWSRTLSPEDQTRLMGDDGTFIADKITDFKAAKEAKEKAAREAAELAKATSQDKSNGRQRRLEAAVPPKGTGGHAPAPQEEDEFETGFKTG